MLKNRQKRSAKKCLFDWEGLKSLFQSMPIWTGFLFKDFVFLSCWNVIAWTSWGFGTDNSSVLQSTLIKHRWMSHWNALIDNNQQMWKWSIGQLVNGHVWSTGESYSSHDGSKETCVAVVSTEHLLHIVFTSSSRAAGQQQGSRLLLGKILPPLSSAVYLSFSFTFLQEVRGLVFISCFQ